MYRPSNGPGDRDYHRRRQALDGRGLSPLTISLLVQLWQQVERLPVKPVITIVLLAMNIVPHVTYIDVVGYDLANISQNCLHPAKIFHSLQAGDGILVNRLLLSSLIHADDYHLYYNMLSLCYKGINLERELGSTRFLQLVAFSLLASHSIMVLLAYVLHNYFDYSNTFNSCAVGFSAVLFSLKYVWNRYADSNTNVFGISVPTKYAAWAELVMISLVTPNASFVGHLAGIMAGMLYIHVPQMPIVRGLMNQYGGVDSSGGGYGFTANVPSYTYASGYANVNRSTATTSASASVSPSRTSTGNPDYRPASGSSSHTPFSSSSSSSASSSSYPFPSAPPLPREYQAGEVLDVVYIDDIDEEVEVEEVEVREVKVAERGRVPGRRSGNGSDVGVGVGSSEIDLSQASATATTTATAVDSNEVRRRRLERFNRS